MLLVRVSSSKRSRSLYSDVFRFTMLASYHPTGSLKADQHESLDVSGNDLKDNALGLVLQLVEISGVFRTSVF
ncbi:hypothetical protein Tco_0724352 [Tanacetum coccineum]